MGGFCPVVELHREGYAPAACAAGLFINMIVTLMLPQQLVFFLQSIEYNKIVQLGVTLLVTDILSANSTFLRNQIFATAHFTLSTGPILYVVNWADSQLYIVNWANFQLYIVSWGDSQLYIVNLADSQLYLVMTFELMIVF